jgi:hypothetical protein
MVFGQVTSDDPQEEFTAVETAYNSWRNDAIQALRAGGRLLAQELQLIEQDVAPRPGVAVPPSVFANQLRIVDGELRRKLQGLEETARLLTAEGLRDSTAYTENAVARSQLAQVLRGLHEPKPTLEKFVSESGDDTAPLPPGRYRLNPQTGALEPVE